MRLACETKDERIREQLIEMARQWLLLLLEEELSVAPLCPPMGLPMSAPAPLGYAENGNYTEHKKDRTQNKVTPTPGEASAEERQGGE
jgi:hypothetical protein